MKQKPDAPSTKMPPRPKPGKPVVVPLADLPEYLRRNGLVVKSYANGMAIVCKAEEMAK